MFAACLVLLVSTSSRPAANFPPPEWAYPATPRGFTPDPDDGNPKHLAGSTRAYTYGQIEDSFAPAEWYPNDHPAMPKIPVASGRKPDVRACSWCHLPNGLGRPQSGNLTGLQADFMAQQLADFKSGARHASVRNSIMAIITRALTPEETTAAIDYFVKLPRKPWIAVIEAEMAPFVARVPMGAVKRGQALVEGMRLTAISRRRRWPVDRPPTSCGSSTTCRAALAPAERRS